MSDPTERAIMRPLTAPEARLLLEPSTGGYHRDLKLAFLQLAMLKRIRIVIGQMSGVLQAIKTIHLHLDPNSQADALASPLPAHLDVVLSIVRDFNGCTVSKATTEAARRFRSTLFEYRHYHVGEALTERGLAYMRDRKVLCQRFRQATLTDAGLREQARLRELVIAARDIPQFIREDPERAARIALRLSGLILVVDKLRQYIGDIALLVQQGYGRSINSVGETGFDNRGDGVDLASLDIDTIDALLRFDKSFESNYDT